jgi:single-strand DNA-binding protein
MAFCKIMFIGNLGRDPEMRYMPNGRPVTQFSVAVSHSKPDGQGGWVDEGTDWFRVSVFGDRAERVADQFRKGMKVFVEGRLKTSEYMSKDNEKRFSLDVSADNVINLAARGSGDDGAGGGTFAGAPVGAAAPSGGGSSRPPADDTDLDDLPF